MTNIRRLVTMDIALMGTRMALAEYALGIVLPLILGMIAFNTHLFGPTFDLSKMSILIWLAGIAANYLPLFVFAILIAKTRIIKEEGLPKVVQVRWYGIRHVIVLIPFLVAALTLIQELRRHWLENKDNE
jgi:hypothetical protein